MAVSFKNPYLSYLLIGLVLIVLFVGSVFAVNKYSQRVRQEQQIAKESDEKEKSSTSSEKETTKSNQSANTNGSKSSTSVNSSTQSASVVKVNKNSDEKIPQTGVGFDLIKATMIFIMSVVVFDYFASRRAVSSL